MIKNNELTVNLDVKDGFSQGFVGLVPSAPDSRILNPYFLSGFTDGEGCFFIEVRKSDKYKAGFAIQCCFLIALHSKDQALLEGIQSTWGGVGKITKQRKDSLQYRVFSMHELRLVIDHFEKYPLLTQKRADFELFKQAFELISRKEHLTTKGLEKLIGIKASANNGLSPALEAAFPSTVPALRPLVKGQEIKDPN